MTNKPPKKRHIVFGTIIAAIIAAVAGSCASAAEPEMCTVTVYAADGTAPDEPTQTGCLTEDEQRDYGKWLQDADPDSDRIEQCPDGVEANCYAFDKTAPDRKAEHPTVGEQKTEGIDCNDIGPFATSQHDTQRTPIGCNQPRIVVEAPVDYVAPGYQRAQPQHEAQPQTQSEPAPLPQPEPTATPVPDTDEAVELPETKTLPDPQPDPDPQPAPPMTREAAAACMASWTCTITPEEMRRAAEADAERRRQQGES